MLRDFVLEKLSNAVEKRSRPYTDERLSMLLEDPYFTSKFSSFNTVGSYIVNNADLSSVELEERIKELQPRKDSVFDHLAVLTSPRKYELQAVKTVQEGISAESVTSLSQYLALGNALSFTPENS
ncbi:MAG: hypothetical protein ACMXYD_00765 [Candidatus Woesearchaeota archaeon]